MPEHPCQRSTLSRRQALAGLAALVVPACSRKAVVFNPHAPSAPVSIARCGSYGAELAPTLGRMFDQLGGLGRLVAGKTVALKVNMTGGARQRLGTVPSELSHFTHPAVISATVRHLAAAGAKRIRVLEGCFALGDPLEEFMLDTGWDPSEILNAAPNVEMENTNFLGHGRSYHRLMAARGGYIFPGFDFNHSWAESDVVISMAKLKEHATAGITLGMKNMFGATPVTIYGDGAGKDEPSVDPRGGRGDVMHAGNRGPSKSAPQELDPSTPRDQFYRMPRILVDVCAALPVHLTIIDGIVTMLGGEGPWIDRTMKMGSPGVLIAGLNPVSTDAVAVAVMGYDPAATRGQPPFDRCDSFLELAEARGLGTRDLRRIEVVGTPIKDALYPFRKHRPGSFPGEGWV
ncbi:MAG: DUF362 domain-containing protein [Bryobacteraceae bacterium]